MGTRGGMIVGTVESFEMFSNSERGRRTTAMQELHRASSHNVTVAEFLAMWKAGGIATFEEMQTRLIVELVRQLEYFQQPARHDFMAWLCGPPASGRLAEVEKAAAAGDLADPQPRIVEAAKPQAGEKIVGHAT